MCALHNSQPVCLWRRPWQQQHRFGAYLMRILHDFVRLFNDIIVKNIRKLCPRDRGGLSNIYSQKCEHTIEKSPLAINYEWK